jgi:hypothetical protein
LSYPNRREFIRKFFEFAPRGAFQARIPGDFSPFERNRASVFAETVLFNVASAVSRAASNLSQQNRANALPPDASMNIDAL